MPFPPSDPVSPSPSPSTSRWRSTAAHLSLTALVAVVAGAGGAHADDLLTGLDIKNHSITSKDLARGAVSARQIKAGSITAQKLTQATRVALDGSRWFSGAGAPAAGLTSGSPVDGDWYLDTTTSDVYTLLGNAWGFVVNIGGAVGPQGLQGEKGDKGETGAAGAAGPAGLAGAPGTNGTNGAAGVKGDKGTTWLTGAADPTSADGVVDDWWLNTSTNQAWQKTATGWVSRVNLRGATGQQGQQGVQGQTGESGANGLNGATWWTGSGAPGSTTGSTGDLYLDTATSQVYRKDAGGWTSIATIKGAQGIPGIQGNAGSNGTNGTNGANGALWLTGTSVPSDAAGQDGDLYLKTDTGQVFKKSGGTWGSSIANLTGPTGAAGSGTTWTSGTAQPTGGQSGDYYLETDTGSVYLNASGVWTSVYTPAASSGGGAEVLVQADTSGQSAQGSLPLAAGPPVPIQFTHLVTGTSTLWNGTTFTAPATGYYQVEVQVLAADASPASSSVPVFLQIDVNGDINGERTIVAPYPTLHSVVSTGWRASSRLSALVRLDAGETFKVDGRSANSSTAAQPIRATAASFVTIAQVG